MSEYLDMKAINYTGSTRVAIELDFNKENAKVQVHQAGLPTAEHFTALPGQYAEGSNLPLQFPLFVKPLDTGGGKGVGNDSAVTTFLQFQQKVAAIYSEFGSSSLVESYLTGREFSVAILGNGSADELIVMPIELVTEENEAGHRILGDQVKSDDTERAIAEDDIRSMVIELAKNIYQTLGARDLGRIDIRMDAAGKPHFLEANLVPGLADNDFVSYFNRACQINEGIDYKI